MKLEWPTKFVQQIYIERTDLKGKVEKVPLPLGVNSTSVLHSLIDVICPKGIRYRCASHFMINIGLTYADLDSTIHNVYG